LGGVREDGQDGEDVDEEGAAEVVAADRGEVGHLLPVRLRPHWREGPGVWK